MPITPANPFDGRQYSGDVILLPVRWYFRYALAYEHMPRCWQKRPCGGCQLRLAVVQAYAPEINKPCRPHLRRTNKSYRIDETYINIKDKDRYLPRC
jgi:IS6 family transposase